ncbi:hypothetical protein [Pedobacter sp.]|uniref:hypothetical protein n=1 Tax=Pedobacter sp. TaxID=1411316 RepID=UPI003C50CBD2
MTSTSSATWDLEMIIPHDFADKSLAISNEEERLAYIGDNMDEKLGYRLSGYGKPPIELIRQFLRLVKINPIDLIVDGNEEFEGVRLMRIKN